MKLVVFVAMLAMPHATGMAAPAVAKAAAAKPTLITLDKIESESDDAATLITVRLDRKPSWDQIKLEEHGTFIQFSMPGVMAPNPGEFLDVPGPYAAKIGVFQPKSDVASMRIFVRKEAADIILASTADVLDDRIVFKLDHKKYVAVAATRATPVLTGAQNLEAEKVIERTEVRSDIPEPAKLIKSTAAESPAIGSGIANLKGKMIGVSIFCGVMLLILVGLHLFKPILRRARKSQAEDKPNLGIKTIATQALSPKQRLAVVQVGHQKFLIGITPDQVSLVSELDATPPAATSARVRAPATSQARLSATETSALQAARTKLDISAANKSSVASKSMASLPPSRAPKVVDTRPLRPAAATTIKSVSPSRINVAIGDDGVINKGIDVKTPASNRSVEDVTRLIREKLSKLSSLPT